MPTTTALHARPTVTALTDQENEVLYAIGCGLADAEIADLLAVPEHAVAWHLRSILAKLGLRDRAAAIVHAFDCGLVTPGHGPRRHGPGPMSVPWLRISVLGPLRACRAGRFVDLGPVRQQAVLAALALSPDRSVSRRELLDGVWGTNWPDGNVVPVYVYRLRKVLRRDDRPDPVIGHDRYGYRLDRGLVDVDVAHMEELAAAAGGAERAGDLAEAMRLCGLALDLFRGEPLAGLPGPSAESARLRLVERRAALTRRRAGWQLRLGRYADAVAGLSALALEQPLNEPVCALLMCALTRNGLRADALAVFDRARRKLADELGVRPGELLLRARRAVLRGEGVDPVLVMEDAA
ncbi:BTAD domain-containing putative transcriptional regulator [Streptantibioticus cattleyicolor]|nr:BTAD domain-containing putative transcriptional regulator [Streptantibioticus cattleyicolor]